jgi:8-amino-7-oxononanoate synthase
LRDTQIAVSRPAEQAADYPMTQPLVDGGERADVFSKCNDFVVARRAREAGVYTYFREIGSAQDPVVEIGDRDLIMLGSNNYLGLANHPKVKEASVAAVLKYGTGCAGSRLLNGTLDIHARLEERLAEFMRREAVLTFSTGFQVNLGVLSALLGRHDYVFLDSLDHACIIDGARLGFAKLVKFRHNDTADLARKLDHAPADYGRLIVVDGVFSMEGDVCPLPAIVECKRRFGARLMVDDAHGVGVLGDHGRGTAEHFGLESEVDLVMGTFSKSLAAVGGFVAGDRDVIDFIRHKARSYIFSAAFPPASVAAVLAALDIVESEPERRERLWENTRYMQRELVALGFDIGESDSPVIPILVGDDWTAFAMVKELDDLGVFVNPVITPAVPPGRALLRTSYMSTHTREHLDRALAALAEVGKKHGII